jgi:hypothetical protein
LATLTRQVAHKRKHGGMWNHHSKCLFMCFRLRRHRISSSLIPFLQFFRFPMVVG